MGDQASVSEPTGVARQVAGPDAIDGLLVLLLLAGSACLYLVGLGSYPLWDPWEPNYGQAMREMAARGDYLTPHLDGWIRWTKPILYYWAMLVPMKIWGNNELTVRLPSALAAAAGLFVLFSALRELRGRATAMIAACVLGTMPQYVFLARQGMPDMLTTFFLTAAMGFFALGRFGTQHNGLYFHVFYLSAALALLTKGPVTSALILGAVGLYWLLEVDARALRSPATAWRELRALGRRYHVVSGVLLFLAISAPWFVYMVIQDWEGFYAYFLMWENIQRFSEPIRDHHGLVDYYVRIFFHGMYPWSTLVAASACFLFAGTTRLDDEARQRWYYLSWLLAPFLLFSIAATKQPHYILPMTPALAVLAALFWEDYLSERESFWVRPVLIVSVLFLFLTLRDFSVEGNRHLIGTFTNRRTIALDSLEPMLGFVLMGWATAVLLAQFLRRSRLVVAIAVLVAFAQGLYFSHVVLPEQAPKHNLTAYVDLYRRSRSGDSELVVFGKHRYSVSYYLGDEKVHRFWRDEGADLVEFVKDKPHVFIIAEEHFTKPLLRILREKGPFEWRRISKEHPSYDLVANEPGAESPSK